MRGAWSSRRQAGALILLLAMAASPAFAQGAALAPAAPPAAAPPAFEDQLLRLSEILGAMHYLRDLCGAAEGGLWREQMQGLIDAEQPDADRRARLVDRFNRGYDSYRSVYRTCTAGATETIASYLAEGAKIARDITARYGK